jgi:hypothetical protein
MKRIVSAKYRDASRGQPCKLRILNVCTGGGEDTVFAHIRDRHTGRSIKASDISGVDACFACHDRFDGRNGMLNDADWHFYALRGLQETIEDRINRGLLFVQLDPERLSHDRPVKPRKAKADRKPITGRTEIQSRGFEPGHRPLQSRPLRKEQP